MARITLIISLLLLGACQGLPRNSEDSPYYDVPTGSILILNETITIPADRTSVYLQGGKVLPYSEIDPYYPHCQFDVRTRKNIPQKITRDRFIIYKIDHMISAINRGIMVAGLRITSTDNGGLSHQTYATMLYLRSEQQPDVLVMTCQHWEDPSDAEYVTIKQIRKALGPVFTLELLRKGA